MGGTGGPVQDTPYPPLRGPAQPLAAVRSGACEAVLRKQSALTHGGSMAPSMAPTVLQRPTRPACQVSCGRGREGRNQGQEQKQKGSRWLPFLFPRASSRGRIPLRSKGLWPLPLLTLPPREGWKGRVGRAARYRWRHGWRHRAPWKGSQRVPGSLIRRVLQYTDIPTGNALNLTAPRKYPPRPCRCRCTWSPCRISAGDDAGRAAASRCGSRRSHPADGPGRSRRPAG